MKENILIAILAWIVYLIVTWAIVVGAIHLIAWLLGLKATIKIATGIWLIIGLIKIIFANTNE